MKKTVVFLLSILIVVSVVACQPAAPAEAPQAEEAPSTEPVEETMDETKTAKMCLSMPQLDSVVWHAWTDYLEIAVQEEGEARGYEVEWSFTNANGDVTKQANDIKDHLTADCDVIFAAALDSTTILSSISEVHDAGKFFVMYFREASPDATGDQIPDATVNMDSEHQAYGAMVETFNIMAKDGVEPTGIINVHGDIGDENAVNRNRGFLKAVEEFGFTDKILVTVDTGRWEPEVALQNTASALQAYPDANVMYVASDWLMSGVQTAMENANKWHKRGEEGHVYLGGTDMYPSGIQMVRDGYMDGNVDVPCYPGAQQSAIFAFDLLEGKEVPSGNTLVKGTVINSDNVEEVIAANPYLWGIDYADQE
jgi:ABC-type sugar transport system substrate-binding protein